VSYGRVSGMVCFPLSVRVIVVFLHTTNRPMHHSSGLTEAMQGHGHGLHITCVNGWLGKEREEGGNGPMMVRLQ
jgi:hypothetical protein